MTRRVFCVVFMTAGSLAPVWCEGWTGMERVWMRPFFVDSGRG